MGRATGIIYSDQCVVRGFFLYNGTADIAVAQVFDTRAELSDVWNAAKWLECTCGEPPEPVFLYSLYGGSFHWQGKVCFNCHAIVEGYAPPFGDDNFARGLPAGCELPEDFNG